MNAYAGFCCNESIRMASSSGGIFSVFAEYILSNNGVVYAVRMAEDLSGAVYTRIDNIESLQLVQGSKYMQAKIGDTFRSVKYDLNHERRVLFVGTACTINGLSMYLQKDYNNLILVDIICHGVPSHLLWKKYCLYRSACGEKIERINFRSKEYGWYNSGVLENTHFISQENHWYMNLFLKDMGLRPSCYECVNKKGKKSDITIGDLWGVYSVAPELNDNKGLSSIITRTKRGNDLFENISNQLIYKEISYNQAILENPCEYASILKPKMRMNFYTDLNRLSFPKLYKRYATYPIWKKVIRRLQRLILQS